MQSGLSRITARLFKAEPRQDGASRQRPGDPSFDNELEEAPGDRSAGATDEAEDAAVEARDSLSHDVGHVERAVVLNPSPLVRVLPRAPNTDGKGLKVDVLA